MEILQMNVNIDYKKFGSIIKHLRQNEKSTQQNICDSVGISVTHYSNIENGLAKPSLEVLVSLVNYFNIPLSSTLLEKDRAYRVPFDIKCIFSESSDSVALNVLDIISFAQTQILQPEVLPYESDN